MRRTGQSELCVFNVCGLTCFDDVLFHSKIATEDEAEVADDSSKLNICMRELVCGYCKVVLTADVDLQSDHYTVCFLPAVAQYLRLNLEINRPSVGNFRVVQSD